MPTSGAQTSAGDQKVEAAILNQPDDRELVFWVMLRADANLGAAPSVGDWTDRGELVVDTLQGAADSSQKGLVETLDARGADYEPFWISNTVRVTGPRKLAQELAARPEVEQVLADRTFSLPEPVPAADVAPQAVEWNVDYIRAPEVWSTFGTRGEGIVIANIDTGVQFDHPAVVAQYRGNSGGVFDHNYNWFDPSKVCGNPSLAPCDNDRHGTHTMGTMVGGDGATEQVGVAPGARWIAAKGCEFSSCSLSALLASGQWLLAPTDLNGENPRPDLRPDIVNNSWGGGGGNTWFSDIVSSWVAAGIFPVFSNGNRGSACSTSGSPGDYASSYSAGAHDSGGVIAGFSSRGSAASGLKPNITAPGVNVRSSVPSNGYAPLSGTSMAAPHVAGTIALVWSAAPSLVSDVAATRAVLDQTAIDTSDLTCGGTAANNNVWGEGRLDAFAAVQTSPRGPTGTLQGVVSREGTGEPIPGAQVRAAGAFTRSAVTNPAGQLDLRLPTGTYQVTAAAFGFTPAGLEVVITEDTTTVQDFVLDGPPRHGVSGTVADDAGSPVAGMKVTIPGTPVPPSTTDGAGSFAFADIPEGEYQLVVAGPGCHAGGRQTLVVDEDETLDFSLERVRDSFGYSCQAVTPDYIEAGTVLALSGDDSVRAVPLPFPFSFYGTSYGTAQVSVNGLVGFTAASSIWVNTAIPSTSTPNGAIYPYWDDLYMDSASSVRTQLLGSEPDRRFVIEWRNLGYHGDLSRRVDFEVVLSQKGGILLQYRNIGDDVRERGGEATIGVENATGTVALAWSFNQPSLATAASAVRFDTLTSASNVAPDAVDDTATAARNVPTNVPVLANDDDPESDPLGVTAVSDPPHGTATVNPDKTVAYRSDPAWAGPDSFTYDLSDGRGGTDRATVSMTVEAPPPPDAGDDAATTPEDVQTTVAVLANDSDPANSALTLTGVSDPPRGGAWINPDSTVTYSPDPDTNGPDSFTYDVRNAVGDTDTATVAVAVSPVNDLPVAVGDTATTPEDIPVNVAVLGNDSDVDGDPLAVSAVSDPPHGTATVAPDKRVAYQPDRNWSGTDSFTYDLSDGHGGTRTATVSVQVTWVNDPPDAVDDAVTTLEDTPATVAVLANDAEPEGEPLTVTAVADPPHGAATINPDRTVRYLPDRDYAGADSFTYDVGDGRGGTARATVRVTVTDVPEPPPPPPPPLPPLPVVPKSPTSVWANPSAPSYDGMGHWILPVNVPKASAGQLPPAYSYNHLVWFMDGRSSATLALSIGPEGRRATFTVQMPDGTRRTAQVPLPWKAGTPYFLYTYHLGGGLWGAWAIDGVTGVVTTIGTVSLSPQNTKLFHVTMTSTSWLGTPATACAKFPRSQAMFLAPVGFVGGQLSSASPGRPEVWGTGCAAAARTQGPWTVYEVGSP